MDGTLRLETDLWLIMANRIAIFLGSGSFCFYDSCKVLEICLLARPLNLAAMSDLRSSVKSQIQEVLHLPRVF